MTCLPSIVLEAGQATPPWHCDSLLKKRIRWLCEQRRLSEVFSQVGLRHL